VTWEPPLPPPEPPPYSRGRVFWRLALPVVGLLVLGSLRFPGYFAMFNDVSFFLVLAVIAIPVRLIALHRARNRVWGPHNVDDLDATERARLWQAPPAMAAVAAAAPMRWTGRASIATEYGMFNAGAFKGVLELVDGHLDLRVRWPVIRPGAAQGPILDPAQTDVIFPARWGFRKGVGIKGRGMPASYFFSADRDRILWALAARGFPVSNQERRVTHIASP
jgi:hypothetical protein